MEEGFYYIKPNIYYGKYDPQQTKGRIMISAIKPEYIKTDMQFSQNTYAVILSENHTISECEVDMLNALNKIIDSTGVHNKSEVDFKAAEQKLGIELPREIKILYEALSQNETLMSGIERFLPLDELCIDDDNLVFYKVKRTPTAYSLSKKVIMRYYKKEWIYDSNDLDFLRCVLEMLAIKSIKEMPFTKKAKIKGELKNVISPREPLREIFKGKLELLEEYNNYGNIILFNKSGALGWFRQNGFYADILVGCLNETILNEIMSADLQAVWE